MPPDDRYTTANILDDRTIMADKEKCRAALPLEIDKQIQDLRLNRNVMGGDRLVENNEFWIECKRARNPDTLSLAAGELWCAAASAALRGAARLTYCGIGFRSKTAISLGNTAKSGSHLTSSSWCP